MRLLHIVLNLSSEIFHNELLKVASYNLPDLCLYLILKSDCAPRYWEGISSNKLQTLYRDIFSRFKPL